MISFNYSVVIPYGKKEGNFNRCITSVLLQSIQPEKIVVVCNGQISQLHIQSLTDDFNLLKNNIIYFLYPDNCENANVARNIGLDSTSSDWVAFLDSDDWWEDAWISEVVNKLKDKESDFLYGSIRVHGTNNIITDLICDHYTRSNTPENYLLSYQPAQTSTYLIKTSLAKIVRWDAAIRRHQDYDFFVRLVNSARDVGVIKRALVNVDWSKPRVHKFHNDCLDVVKKWKNNVEKRYYMRHLNNLGRSAFRSRDWIAFCKISIYWMTCLFSTKGYLVR